MVRALKEEVTPAGSYYNESENRGISGECHVCGWIDGRGKRRLQRGFYMFGAAKNRTRKGFGSAKPRSNRYLEDRSVGCTADIFASAVLAEPDVAIDNALATQIDLLWDASDLHAFIDVVVTLHMVSTSAHGMGGLGIPHENIGIGSDRDGALLRITAENLGWIGTHQFNEAHR